MESRTWGPILVSGDDNGSRSANGVTVVGLADPVGLVDRFAAARDEGSPVVVGIPRALAASARVALTLATGRHPEVASAWFVSDHGPLGIFAALAAGRSHTADPGVGVATARALLEITWSGAVVPGVSRLPAPNPTLGQHLRSYLPGSSFLVRHGPDPAVLTARGDLRPSALRIPATPLPRVLVATPGLAPAVLDAVRNAARPAAVRQFDLPGSWNAVYRSSGVHQLVLLPDVTHLALPALRGECPSCGHRVFGTACPFCRIRTRHPVAAGPLSAGPLSAGRPMPGAVPGAEPEVGRPANPSRAPLAGVHPLTGRPLSTRPRRSGGPT